MIVSFRHKGLQLLFEKGDRRRVAPDQAAKIERILARLDEASGVGDMSLPGFRLHPLKGACRLLGGDSFGQQADRLSLRGRAGQQSRSARLSLGGLPCR